MITADYLTLRLPQRTAGQKRDIELCPGDVATLQEFFPEWDVWKQSNQSSTIIHVTDEQRITMLQDVSEYLQSHEWDREPYMRENRAGGERITWSGLFQTVLIPALS